MFNFIIIKKDNLFFSIKDLLILITILDFNAIKGNRRIRNQKVALDFDLPPKKFVINLYNHTFYSVNPS